MLTYQSKMAKIVMSLVCASVWGCGGLTLAMRSGEGIAMIMSEDSPRGMVTLRGEEGVTYPLEKEVIKMCLEKINEAFSLRLSNFDDLPDVITIPCLNKQQLRALGEVITYVHHKQSVALRKITRTRSFNFEDPIFDDPFIVEKILTIFRQELFVEGKTLISRLENNARYNRSNGISQCSILFSISVIVAACSGGSFFMDSLGYFPRALLGALTMVVIVVTAYFMYKKRHIFEDHEKIRRLRRRFYPDTDLDLEMNSLSENFLWRNDYSTYRP